MRVLAAVLLLTSACGPAEVRVDAVAPFQQAQRPDNPSGGLFEFDEDDVVEHFDSTGGAFRVHYTRDGDNAVPSTDQDADGIPDFVEDVGEVYDQALAFYESIGFQRPAPDGITGGGVDRFDVYLVDFGGTGDGAFRVDRCVNQVCIGFMTQENDFSGYGYPSRLVGVRIVGSHELFHAVQAAYDAGQGAVLSEGTATWATEAFAPELEDFERQIVDYFTGADQAIDRGQGYGHAIFFRYLAERFGNAFIRILWEACENGARGVADPYWLDQLDDLLREEGTTFTDAFITFAIWNLHTSIYADAPYYDNGADYPLLTRERASPPYSDEIRLFYGSSQTWTVRPEGRASMFAELVAEDAQELDDLHLVLTVDGAPHVDPTEPVTTSGADRLEVTVVNTATREVIRRPHLCIGTVDEVRSCTEAVVPPPPEPDKDGGGCAAAAGVWWVALPLLRRRRREGTG